MMTDVEVYDMEFSFGLRFNDNDDIRDVPNLVLLPQKPYQTAPSIFFLETGLRSILIKDSKEKWH